MMMNRNNNYANSNKKLNRSISKLDIIMIINSHMNIMIQVMIVRWMNYKRLVAMIYINNHTKNQLTANICKHPKNHSKPNH